MNRRQKMKRMKRELEWYKKQMVPTREVGYGSERLEVKTLVNVSYYHMHDYYGRRLENMYREVGATLAHVIHEKYIEYSEEPVDMYGDQMMKVTAKIRVVPKE
mgnify:CR=1 FL=1